MVTARQGYLVDWDAQKAVWDGIFSAEVLGVSQSINGSTPNPNKAP
jgi:hypothetical protein